MANIKTAISIPKKLFDAANQLAEELNVSRSHVFVIALQDFFERRKNKELLAQINEIYDEELDDEERKIIRRAANNLRKVDW